MLAVFTDNLPDPRPAVAHPDRLAAISSYRLGGHAGDSDLDAVVAYMARAVLTYPEKNVELTVDNSDYVQGRP